MAVVEVQITTDAAKAGLALPPPRPDAPGPDPAREAVVRLSRAVQRAAIYPPEHPSVRLALGSFLESLHRLVRSGRRLMLVVMRDRLVVSSGNDAPEELQQGRWLASQLYGRRITSLTFLAALDPEACLRLVHWLAQPVTDSSEAPVPAGVRLTQLDYSRAEFDESPLVQDPESPEAIAAWNALAVGLLSPGTVARSVDAPLEPVQIASAIHADLAAAEGTGVSSVTGRLIRAGRGIAQLPESERRRVRERLAEVVSALPDEIRRQIFSIVPEDHPDKIDLLIEVLDALPRSRLLELVPRVDMTPGAHVRQFLAFLVKLVSLAQTEPAVGAAMEAQLSRHGLPVELLQADADGAQRLLDELFAQTPTQSTSTGEHYQASLQELNGSRRPGPLPLDLSTYGNSGDAPEAAAHLAHIALHLVRANPGDASTRACLIHAREAARQHLDAGRIDLLAELAAVVEAIAPPADPPTRRLREECLELCRDERAAALLLAVIDAHEGPLPDSIGALFVVSGVPAATLAVIRMGELPGAAPRQRLGHLVARLELDVVRQAVMRAHEAGAPIGRILPAFLELDPARTPDVARLFVHDKDPVVRRQALEVLIDAPLSPAKREWLVQRALDDEDPGVVTVALCELSLHQTAGGLASLAEFLARRESALEPLQTYAVRALRQAWTPNVIDALAPALLARRRAFDSAARHVSRAIVSALDAVRDDRAKRAVRRWRRSPAGLWNTLVSGRAGAAS